MYDFFLVVECSMKKLTLSLTSAINRSKSLKRITINPLIKLNTEYIYMCDECMRIEY